MNGNGKDLDTYKVEINGDVFEVSFVHDEHVAIIDGERVQLDVQPKSVPDHYSMLIDGISVVVAVDPQDEVNRYRVHTGGYDFDAEVISAREAFLREYLRAAGVGQGDSRVKAPMPGLIIEVQAGEGAEVEQDEVVLIMEAMKMENVIKAPIAGKITGMKVEAGSAVEKGQVLFEVEE